MEANPISIVDIRIPFWRLVMFFVKAAFAAIPAAIIVSAIYFAGAGLFFAFIGGRI